MKDFTLEELEKSEPKEVNTNGESRILLPQWIQSNGVEGGYLFGSVKDAIEHKEFEIKKLRSKMAREEKEKEEKQRELEIENNYISSFNGFLSENPLKRGKQIQTFKQLIRWGDDKITDKKEYIEEHIKLGYIPKIGPKALYDKRGRFIGYSEDKTEYLIWSEEKGLSSVINKTEFEYAQFLLAAR
jgi:hypothetical protein